MSENQVPRQLRVLLVTDVFPPGSGGSGWSTFYLAKALAERGHRVGVLRPLYESGGPVRREEYDSVPVQAVPVTPVPQWLARSGLGPLFREEKAVRVLARIVSRFSRRWRPDVVHGQHMVSVLAAVKGARRGRSHRPALVATIRDYWPLCPSSTRLVGRRDAQECVDCHKLMRYLECALRPGVLGLASRGADLVRWGRTRMAAAELNRCDAVVAVSSYVRAELSRSGRVAPRRLSAIPNLVHLASVDRALSGRGSLPGIAPGEPFVLFAGKLERNKGAHLLPEVLQLSGVRLPLLVAGDGPLQGAIEGEARARGLDVRFCSWLDNDAVLLLMSRATALLFPSAWQEPLSRVLLEGCAAGAAIAALDSGGTADIITHQSNGWLARDLGELAEGLSRLASDPAFNERVRRSARMTAEERFASGVVSAQVEALYMRCVGKANSA